MLMPFPTRKCRRRSDTAPCQTWLGVMVIMGAFLGMVFGIPGCGAASKSKSSETTPSFLALSSRVTAGRAGMPTTVASLEVASKGCRVSPPRTDLLLLKGQESTFLNFVEADNGCSFALTQLVLTDTSGQGGVTFLPVSESWVSPEAPKLKVRLKSQDETKVLLAEISTTYDGTFDEAPALVLIFAYENIRPSLGAELKRVDNDQAVSLGATTGDPGVGLRIDSMVARKSPDNSGIIALEVRFSCLSIRKGLECMGRDLTEYEFVFVAGLTSTPTSATMDAAFGDVTKVTMVTTENIFANGVYALVATPERLPLSNTPPTTLWLFVRTGELISGFEVSTAGLTIF